jgi:plasmid stabilization system protein ParE
MAFLVNFTARAERDLAALYEEINAEEAAAARRWYLGLKESILALEQLPYAWPVTRESRRLRHLLYGRKPHVYRVIYHVLKSRKQVDILHIRRGARRHFTAADLK